MREEPYRFAAARRLENAIVVIESPSGRGLDDADLARNDADLEAPVLYARADASMSELRRRFPERSIWRYKRERDKSADLTLAFPAASAPPVQPR
jgi:hypothetical protein